MAWYRKIPVHLMQPGYGRGYTEFRYGRKKTKAIKPRPIYKGEAREHVILRVLDAMEDRRVTPFENEGAFRAGLRSALCMQGYRWERADQEALDILAESLRRMRAVRPSWDDGQLGHANPKEDCSWCGGAIDDSLMATARRYSFCSEECARFALNKRRLQELRRETRMFADAWDVIQRLRNPARTCGHCERSFRPVVGVHDKFCSLHCSSQARITTEERPCRQCGTSFRPRNGEREGRGYFCSVRCKSLYGFTTRYPKVCEWCSTPFDARVPQAACCSQKCAVAYSNIKSGKRIPRRLSPPVFDYIMRVAA